MIYDFVPFHLVAEEIAKNLENHYDPNEDKMPNLDWDSYLQLSLADRCKVVIIRDNGRLIAYSVFCISQNLNHKEVMEASNTGIFIHKEYRGKVISEFLHRSDEYLRKLGVMEVTHIINDRRFGVLLKRAGYKAKHTVWSNKL